MRTLFAIQHAGGSAGGAARPYYPNKFTSDCPAYKMDQEEAYHLWHDDIVAVIEEGFHPSIRITQMLAKLQDARSGT